MLSIRQSPFEVHDHGTKASIQHATGEVERWEEADNEDEERNNKFKSHIYARKRIRIKRDRYIEMGRYGMMVDMTCLTQWLGCQTKGARTRRVRKISSSPPSFRPLRPLYAHALPLNQAANMARCS